MTSCRLVMSYKGYGACCLCLQVSLRAPSVHIQRTIQFLGDTHHNFTGRFVNSSATVHTTHVRQVFGNSQSQERLAQKQELCHLPSAAKRQLITVALFWTCSWTLLDMTAVLVTCLSTTYTYHYYYTSPQLPLDGY